MADPAATLAATFVARCRRDGLRPDPTLRLLAHLDEGTAPATGDESLGRLHERLTSPSERRDRGAWYTPSALAADLVARVVDRPMSVADPACGGGVFLMAAADRLADLGVPPATVVRDSLWGADIDALAVAVTEAELWRWSAERGEPAVAGERLVVGDALVDVEIPPVSVVVGNPPFLGQLKSATSSDADRRTALSQRWGPAMQPYTDAAWLFLLAAVEAVAAGGAVAMVMPQSVLAARDAGVIRSRIDERARLDDCWVDDGRTFDAAVDVCAPVLRVHGATSSAAGANDWVGAMGSARGIPSVVLVGASTVGQGATVLAGFRDEYYGLVDAVDEGGNGPRLVTSGAVDPFRLVDAPIRFAKRRWTHPTVDVDRASGRAARWVRSQSGPKIVVASQTKVLEAVVDPDGSLVAGVPAIVVRPEDPDDDAGLWRLAAAIGAPVSSAWMLRRTAGTALSSDACRPTAALLASLPLPTERVSWDRAAALARTLADGADCWDEFAVAADAAYGVDDEALRSWWVGRLPLR